MIFSSTDHLDPTQVYGLKLGYDRTGNSIVDSIGVEGTVNYFSTKSTSGPKDAQGYIFRVDALYSIFPRNKWVPYVAVGLGEISTRGNGLRNDSPLVNYGLGLKYYLEDYLALRFDVRHLLVYKNVNTQNDFEFGTGLTYYFGKERKKKPAPVAPAPKAAAKFREARLPKPPVESPEEKKTLIMEKLGAVGIGLLGVPTTPVPYDSLLPPQPKQPDALIFRAPQTGSPAPSALPSAAGAAAQTTGTAAAESGVTPSSAALPAAPPSAAGAGNGTKAPAGQASASQAQGDQAPVAQRPAAQAPSAKVPVVPVPAVPVPAVPVPAVPVPAVPVPGAQVPGAQAPGAPTPGAPTPGAQAPGAQAPATQIPAAKGSAAEAPAAVPAAKAPANKAPAAKAPANKTSAAQAPAAPTPGTQAPATQVPAAKGSAAEAPAAVPAAKAPAAKAPANKTSVAQAPAAQAPAAQAPAAQAPAARAPAARAPAARAPAAQAPAAQAPAAQVPAAQVPVAQATEAATTSAEKTAGQTGTAEEIEENTALQDTAAMDALEKGVTTQAPPAVGQQEAPAQPVFEPTLKSVHYLTIEFEFASTGVRPVYANKLRAAAAMIKASPEASILIEGHTDNIGKKAVNDALALQRANSVKKQLVKLGVPPEIISTKGYGFSKPKASNRTAKGRQRNRRAFTTVVIVIHR